MADGSINIDTKMDAGGFKAGMDGILAAAKSGAAAVNKAFEGSFSGDKLGASFQKFVSEYTPAVEKAVDSTKKIAKEVGQNVVPAMNKWHGLTSGIGRIIATMVPGFYKINRAASGLNEVTKSIAGSSGAMAKAFMGIGTVIGITLAAIAIAGMAIFAWAQKTVDTLSKSLSATSGYREQVIQLKTAFDTLKGSMTSLGTTLLTALAPALITIINWLVQAVNWVSMFIAALSGQKTVMQYVSGAAGDAADNAGRLADNTKKAGDAAKGALASFDQLNVLQMAEPNQPGGGGAAGGGNIVLKEVPIDPAILSGWNKFKKAWVDFWNWNWDADAWFKAAVIDPLLASKFWNWKWDANKWFLDSVWTPLITGAFWNWRWDANKWFKASITDKVLNSTVWAWSWDANAWFSGAIWTPFITGAFWYWKFDANAWFKSAMTDPVINSNVWQWKFDANKWFADSLTNPVKNSSIWNWSWDANAWFVDKLLNPFLSGLQTFLNGIIDFFNQFPGMNIERLSIPSVYNPGEQDSPYPAGLARGGIIMPNAPFMAMVGDNKTQKEIIAPEDMIRRIVREETAGYASNSNDTIHNVIKLDGQVLYDAVKKIEKRVGTSLAKATGAA